MVKRIVTKIGNIFCAEIDGKYKVYFQYICSDMSQLNSSVIRVFSRRYPMDYVPKMEEIVNDEVQFYAHTILRAGIADGAWTKVGKSTDLGNGEHKQVLFGYCLSTIFTKPDNRIIEVNPLEHWFIWHIGEPIQRVDTFLSPAQTEILAEGGVMPYTAILDMMKYGYDRWTNPMYDVVKRRPLPDVDSYCRRDGDGVTVFYHFHGENLIREVIVENEVRHRLSELEPMSYNYSLIPIKFWDINWKYGEFITGEEFDQAWQQ